jgi:hypothetical protein
VDNRPWAEWPRYGLCPLCDRRGGALLRALDSQRVTNPSQPKRDRTSVWHPDALNAGLPSAQAAPCQHSGEDDPRRTLRHLPLGRYTPRNGSTNLAPILTGWHEARQSRTMSSTHSLPLVGGFAILHRETIGLTFGTAQTQGATARGRPPTVTNAHFSQTSTRRS